ncbi:MAG: hypothetical protein ACWA40_03650 [Planktomarina sp.]
MELDLNLEKSTAPEMTKGEYARHAGVSNGRISHMIKDGLPVLPNGRIPVQDADMWITTNVNSRSNALKSDVNRLSLAKIEREEAQRDLLLLQVAEKEQRLIDRQAVEQALFERARGERDAHLAWVARVAPKLATELDVDLSLVFSALDREMRDHLTELSQTPLEDLSNV